MLGVRLMSRWRKWRRNLRSRLRILALEVPAHPRITASGLRYETRIIFRFLDTGCGL